MGACQGTIITTTAGLTVPVTNQTKFVSPLSAGTLTAARSALFPRVEYAGDTTWPTVTTGTGCILIPAALGNTFEMRFYGKQIAEPDSPTDLGAFCRIWGLPQMTIDGGCETLGLWIADLVVTFGSKEVYDSAVIHADGKGTGSAWGKQIDIKHDRTLFPGIRHIGMGDFEEEAIPSIVFDTNAFAGFIVQMVKSDPAKGEPDPITNFGFLYRIY